LYSARRLADVLLGGMSFAFLGLFAPSILRLWRGQEQPWASWALQVLAVGESVMLLTSIVSSSLRARGQVGLEFRWAVLNLVVSLLLMIALVPRWEFEGLIYARVGARLISTSWYLHGYFRVSRITWGEYLRELGSCHWCSCYWRRRRDARRASLAAAARHPWRVGALGGGNRRVGLERAVRGHGGLRSVDAVSFHRGAGAASELLRHAGEGPRIRSSAKHRR
jgi:hypothetical protein